MGDSMALSNVFDSLDYLEPKCPNCETILEYGTNTRFDDDIGSHICKKCNTAIK